MDAALDGHWRTYTLSRACLPLLISSVWLTAFPMYVDIYSLRDVSDESLAATAAS